MPLTTASATIVRLVGDNLAYAVTDGAAPRTVSFGPEITVAFVGETLPESGFVEGTRVSLGFDEETGAVAQATKRAETAFVERGGKAASQPVLPRVKQDQDVSDQLFLLPTDPAFESVKMRRAMPTATRKFGKVLDTRPLKAGDLLLSRDLQPEWTGRAIVSVQEEGGYRAADARWTHAAMYVGDHEHVVEATFESPLKGGSVRLTHLDDYCKGEAALRFRRPMHLLTDEERWKLCVRALSRLHKPYSFGTAIQMWLQVAVRGGGFFDENKRFGASEAVVCSTLYADAYNETTRRTLGEICGACVPAWLSVTDEFEDIKVNWLTF
jgi:hypothetical protein